MIESIKSFVGEYIQVLINDVELFSHYVEILKEVDARTYPKYKAIIHENPIR